MDRLGSQASKANKEWLAPQESQAPSGLEEHLSSVRRDRLVLIAVVLAVVVARGHAAPPPAGEGSLLVSSFGEAVR